MGFFYKAFPDISHISQNGLKKLFYNNKMPIYAELMVILKANEIRGYSHYTKSKLIYLLVERGWYLKNMVKINKKKIIKDIDPKYYFLKEIRSNPKKIEIHDLETDKVVLFPSIYKAVLALD